MFPANQPTTTDPPPPTPFTLLQDDRGEAIKVAETVQYFITAMDGVRLEQRAVDELTPMLSDIMTRCVWGGWVVVWGKGGYLALLSEIMTRCVGWGKGGCLGRGVG